MLKLCKKGLIEDKVFEATTINDDYVYACTKFKHNNNEEIVANITVHVNVWEECVKRYLINEHYKNNNKY